MKRKNDYERYKHGAENEKAVEEKIMKRIEDMSENIRIPESLEPENMMKRIDEAKKSDKRLMKKESVVKRNHLNQRFYNRILVCGLSVAVVIAVLFTGFIYNNNSFEFITGSTKVYNQTEQVQIEAGEGTNQVLSAASREEIINTVTSAWVKAYNDRKSYGEDNDYVYGEDNDYVDNATEDFPGGNIGSDNVTITDTNPTENINHESSDYYQNNDQVEGVVESDYLITDGNYIYSITESSIIHIMSADNGTVRNISKINFYDDYKDDEFGNDDKISITRYNSCLFVNKDKVIVMFSYDKMEKDGLAMEEIYCDSLYRYGTGKEYTAIMQYDVSDIQHPELDNYHVIEGDMVSSRMVEDYIYVVTSKNIDMGIDDSESMADGIKRIQNDCIPKIDDKEIPYENIFIAGEGEECYSYVIIASLSIDKNELKVTDSNAVLNNYGEVYVSNNNIYTASEIYEEIYDVIDEEKDSKIITQTISTKIYKFTYENGDITPYAVGKVPGSVLNQFSMDEYNGYLRLVSNINEWRCVQEEFSEYFNSVENNAVYILDENLNTCGSIENIAPNESIYSVRFMGDYGYFVTFRQVDPLFVVDLSNPENPVVLDELKVTGFSSYLHPWSENVLLGVGQEANEYGITKGVKISLFDISNKTNISESGKIVLEETYTCDTDDYKRMLVAPEKSLFGINIADSYSYLEDKPQYCLFKYENGAFTNVFNYRYEGEENDSEFYLYRGLYIGDYLYIVTLDKGVVSVSLKDYSVGEFVEFD